MLRHTPCRLVGMWYLMVTAGWCQVFFLPRLESYIEAKLHVQISGLCQTVTGFPGILCSFYHAMPLLPSLMCDKSSEFDPQTIGK